MRSDAVTSLPAPRPWTRPETEDPEMSLLRAGIPLSLLLDLACGDPHSRELYEQEQAATSSS